MHMIHLIKISLVIIGIGSLLSACSILSPVPNSAPTEYVIDSVPQVVKKKPAHHATIYISQPEATTVFNTTLMAYKVKPHEVSYFSKNRWVATPAQMLQPLIVQTLQKTHHFRAIGSGGAPGNYTYILNTQILDFQQEFFTHASLMTVTIRAQLVKVATNQIVATKEFSVQERAPQNTPYGGVIAANRATAKILAELARWCESR